MKHMQNRSGRSDPKSGSRSSSRDNTGGGVSQTSGNFIRSRNLTSSRNAAISESFKNTENLTGAGDLAGKRNLTIPANPRGARPERPIKRQSGAPQRKAYRPNGESPRGGYNVNEARLSGERNFDSRDGRPENDHYVVERRANEAYVNEVQNNFVKGNAIHGNSVSARLPDIDSFRISESPRAGAGTPYGRNARGRYYATRRRAFDRGGINTANKNGMAARADGGASFNGRRDQYASRGGLNNRSRATRVNEDDDSLKGRLLAKFNVWRLSLSIDGESLVKGGVIAALMIFFCVIQTTLFARFRPFGATPDLILPLVVAVGVLEREKWGAIVGLIGAFVIEALGGATFTLLPLLYVPTGFVCGLLTTYRFRDSFSVMAVYTVVTSFVRSFITMIIAFNTIHAITFGEVFLKIAAPEFLVNIIFAAIPQLLTRLATRPFHKTRLERTSGGE